jgi:superfamily II DNA/RNA helicase
VLRDLIRAEGDDIKNAIIFCNRKVEVSELFRSLTKHDFDAGALHGDMDQRARMTMLANFRDGKLKLLVASDVAARGLDIPDVSHVFNYDVPIHSEDYVHRIGRTGRAGRSGKSFTIVTRNDTKYVDAIEKLIGNEQIEWHDGDLSTVVESKGEERPRRTGRERGGKPARQPCATSGSVLGGYRWRLPLPGFRCRFYPQRRSFCFRLSPSANPRRAFTTG